MLTHDPFTFLNPPRPLITSSHFLSLISPFPNPFSFHSFALSPTPPSPPPVTYFAHFESSPSLLLIDALFKTNFFHSPHVFLFSLFSQQETLQDCKLQINSACIARKQNKPGSSTSSSFLSLSSPSPLSSSSLSSLAQI